MFSDHKTKWLGVLLIVFGTLQTMSDQIRGLLSPTGYAVFAIIVGVLVTTLGALKKGNGGVIASNRTWLTGVLLIVLGALQGYSDQIKDLVTPQLFSLFTIITGVGVGVLGFLNSASNDDGGNSPPASIGALLLIPTALMLLGLGGCTHTRDAYKAAAASDNKLEATAYVISEHYAAVLKEAAALKTSGQLNGSALRAVQNADDILRPRVLGNPQLHVPGLFDLVATYNSLKDAKSAAELQAAINDAVVKLSDLINALKRR